MIGAIREKQSAAPGTLIGRLLPIGRWMLGVERFPRPLWPGRFALLKWREQINRDGKKRGRVMFAGNFAHGLEEA